MGHPVLVKIVLGKVDMLFQDFYSLDLSRVREISFDVSVNRRKPLLVV